MGGNGTHQIHQSPPVQPKGSGLDTTVKILPVVLGVLSALCLGILFIGDKPNEAKVRQMIDDRAGQNTYRIERLERTVEALNQRIERMVEERLRERIEAQSTRSK